MSNKKTWRVSKNPKKHIVKKMQETEDYSSGFGEYQESTGGGHPFDQGNTNTRTTRENGKLRKNENPTTDQPRTGDGKFTYKSVNGKSIDPKYGPSRGVTVPPTLTGGENGVKIDEVEKQFSEKKGDYWDKYQNRWYKKGGKIMTVGLSTKVSGEAIWNVAKEYDESIGEYRYYDEGGMKTESNQWTTKTGRKSDAEKATKKEIQHAKGSDKENKYVIGKKGGIEIANEDKQPKVIAKAKKQPAPTAGTGAGAGTTQQQPAATTNTNTGVGANNTFSGVSSTPQGIGKSKYSDEQLEEAKRVLTEMGFDIETDFASVEELDEAIDEYIDFE